jgi:hypothetical protein
MIIVGIDPGLKGGIAIIDSESANTPAVYPMPVTQEETKAKKKVKTLTKKEKLAKKGGKTIYKTKNIVDSKAFFDILCNVFTVAREVDLVLIEKPFYLGIESRTSTATTAENYGRLRGILESLNLNVKTVRPQEWKNYFDLPADKGEAIAKAKELFPVTNLKASSRSRIDSDGMAEALLIAEYGRKQNAN